VAAARRKRPTAPEAPASGVTSSPPAPPAKEKQLSLLGANQPPPTIVRKPPQKKRAGTPLDEARNAMFKKAARGKGTRCPCCEQYVKIYERKLNASMAYGLIVLLKYQETQPPDAWIHIPTLFAEKKACKANDGALLRHWGLITGKNDKRDDKSKRVGYYRVTELGAAFVRREATVPQRARLYNQVFMGLVGDEINIGDALNTEFSYADLMSR
jgi:hypothetical protein